MTINERIKNALNVKFEPESDKEIYWFNKCKGMEAEIRHLRIEDGKTKAYIDELKHEIKILQKKASHVNSMNGTIVNQQIIISNQRKILDNLQK